MNKIADLFGNPSVSELLKFEGPKFCIIDQIATLQDYKTKTISIVFIDLSNLLKLWKGN